MLFIAAHYARFFSRRSCTSYMYIVYTTTICSNSNGRRQHKHTHRRGNNKKSIPCREDLCMSHISIYIVWSSLLLLCCYIILLSIRCEHIALEIDWLDGWVAGWPFLSYGILFLFRWHLVLASSSLILYLYINFRVTVSRTQYYYCSPFAPATAFTAFFLALLSVRCTTNCLSIVMWWTNTTEPVHFKKMKKKRKKTI